MTPNANCPAGQFLRWAGCVRKPQIAGLRRAVLAIASGIEEVYGGNDALRRSSLPLRNLFEGASVTGGDRTDVVAVEVM